MWLYMYIFLKADELSDHMPPWKLWIRVRKEAMIGSDMEYHEDSVMVLQVSGSVSADDTVLRIEIGSGQLQSLNKP